MKSIILSLVFTACSALAQQPGNSTLPQDRGPNKIDVSGFPAEVQADYRVFAAKCARCHSLARAINTSMPRDGWERDVRRMMNKVNSGINEAQCKQIIAFLVYDQTHRKDKDPKAFFPGVEARIEGANALK